MIQHILECERNSLLRTNQGYFLIFLIEFFIGLFFSPSKVLAFDGENFVTLKGFSDIGYVGEQAGGTNQFRLGNFDLLFSKEVDSKVSFLAELCFEPEYQSGINQIQSDLERIYIQYDIDPWVKFALGKFHTQLGYWNETFHHGAYLHTTVARPQMLAFEDHGGLLPIHSIGFEIRGNGLVGHSNLGYNIGLSNGRGSQKDQLPIFSDANREKAFSGLIFYEVGIGMRLGSSFYFGPLPGGASLSGNSLGFTSAPKGRETIFGVHLVYSSSSVEFLSETWSMKHTYSDPFPDSNILLFYSQLGYHIELLTPYLRYELNLLDQPDAYLGAGNASANPLTGNTRIYIAGVRYELSQWSALKVEGDWRQVDGLSGIWTGYGNWSFTF